MIGSRRLLVAIVLCGLVAGGAAAQPIAASRGVWTGVVGERSSDWPAGAGKVELRVDGTEGRFSINLSAPGEAVLASDFQAGSRKDVFEPPVASGFMSYFTRSTAAKPLEGKPLVWARRAGDELIVYRLDVRAGPYRLDRLVMTPAGKHLQLSFERREHDRLPERFSASLERQQP